MTVAIADDEPPSPGPRADGGEGAPTVTAADERVQDRTPLDPATFAGLLARVLAHEGAPSSAEASLRFVDPDEIARLKVEHLDGDGGATDVLSFPVDGVADDAELIGDVVLCAEVAEAQAAQHAGTLDDELALLVVHGGLHLAGWDHADDDERRAMWARERELMVELHGPPTRDPWSDPNP
jgi:probable rRNA maturation factor